MGTTTDLVRQIKSFLEGGVEVSADAVAAMAREYARLCSDARRRLSECAQLLARGQRGEAIYAAEAPPPLLELMGELDFPGAAQWRDYAAQSGLPSPPPFDTAMIQLLESEYGQQAAVEPLVNLYRKLSVKGGPLRDRIAVLRRLRSADPGNPNWPHDLEVLDVGRIKEIAHALRGRPPTEEEADEYLRDLTDNGLTVRPAAALLQKVAAFRQQLKSDRFEATARRMAVDVHDACGAMDYSAVVSGLNRLEDLAAREGLPVPLAVEDSLADARAWADQTRQGMEEDEQFRRVWQVVVDQIAAAGAPGGRVDKARRADELSQALFVAETFGRELPAGLADQARAAVEHLRGSAGGGGSPAGSSSR